MYDQDTNAMGESGGKPTGKTNRMAALVPVAAAMVGAVLLAMLVHWQRAQGMPRTTIQFDTMAEPYSGYNDRGMGPGGSGWGGRPRWPYEDAFRAQSVPELLLLQPGDQPLTQEPANLTAPQGAQRVAGFRRVTAGTVEEVAFYEAPALSLETVWSHYGALVQQAGYVQVRPAQQATTGRRGMRSRVYLPAGRQDSTAADWTQTDRMLIVRVTPLPPVSPLSPGQGDPGSLDAVTPRPHRIMVWLRYADAPQLSEPDTPRQDPPSLSPTP